eukprot:1768201-Rhodomonas_salina.1
MLFLPTIDAVSTPPPPYAAAALACAVASRCLLSQVTGKQLDGATWYYKKAVMKQNALEKGFSVYVARDIGSENNTKRYAAYGLHVQFLKAAFASNSQCFYEVCSFKTPVQYQQ